MTVKVDCSSVDQEVGDRCGKRGFWNLASQAGIEPVAHRLEGEFPISGTNGAQNYSSKFAHEHSSWRPF